MDSVHLRATGDDVNLYEIVGPSFNHAMVSLLPETEDGWDFSALAHGAFLMLGYLGDAQSRARLAQMAYEEARRFARITSEILGLGGEFVDEVSEPARTRLEDCSEYPAGKKYVLQIV